VGNKEEAADDDADGDAVDEAADDATDLGTVPKRVWRSTLALGTGAMAGSGSGGASNRVCTGPTRSEVGP
jgi:hypothetical protein